MFWAATQKALCHGLLQLKSSSLIHLTITSSPSTAKFWWEALGDWRLEDFSEIIYYGNWRSQNVTGRFLRTASLFIGETHPHAWPWLSSCVTLKIMALESWKGTARIMALRQQRIQKTCAREKKSWTLTPLERNYFPLNSTWYQKWLNTNPGQVAQRALSSLLCWRGWSAAVRLQEAPLLSDDLCNLALKELHSFYCLLCTFSRGVGGSARKITGFNNV